MYEIEMRDVQKQREPETKKAVRAARRGFQPFDPHFVYPPSSLNKPASYSNPAAVEGITLEIQNSRSFASRGIHRFHNAIELPEFFFPAGQVNIMCVHVGVDV